MDLFDNTKQPIIKSFLNYAGGKAVLLPQIMPLLPKQFDTLVDPFCGGGGFFINIDAERYIANDSIPELIAIYKHIQSNPIEDVLLYLDKQIAKYGLTKDNKEAFLKLREDYNSDDTAQCLDLFLLVCGSFCNGMRFSDNRKSEHIQFGKRCFNHPFGKRNFNSSMREKLVEYSKRIKTKNIIFTSVDFEQIDLSLLNPATTLVMCDPPYSLVIADYNYRWNDELDETRLCKWLDTLHEKGFKFTMSNVIANKNKTNERLARWGSKYTMHRLNHDYANSYGGTDKLCWDKKTTQEVFICNY